jgi:uncharacterized protein YqjF (DUF2071 family)
MPWVMTQTWHDLLFAHWPVEPRKLREQVPSGFELVYSTVSGGSALFRST